jgi:two-component sensor histidine kinase
MNLSKNVFSLPLTRRKAGERFRSTLQKEILMRIQTEESLKFSLRDKEVLLQEVHHRVKNNLQVISSLLNLQMARIQDPEQREAFKDSQNRIRSMSLVHELLYQNLDFRKTDYAGYIRSLVLDLLRSYGISTRRIAHEIHVQNVAIPLNKAIPCGLIINELVSNALKYAFPPSFTGKPRLTIRLRALESGQMELTVRDNGVGLPKGFSVKKSDSLGLQLVSMLTEDQLKGRLGIVSRNGTKFIVQFRP